MTQTRLHIPTEQGAVVAVCGDGLGIELGHETFGADVKSER